jgi:hypothetical protein
MPKKVFEVAGVGPVLITKNKRSRHIRLSISPSQQIRISQPLYLPYEAGLQMIKARRAWILKHKVDVVVPASGSLIGKSHRLNILRQPGNKKHTSISAGQINLKLGHDMTDFDQKAAIIAACERALKIEAEKLLAIRAAELAARFGYSFKSLTIKRLTSRWGSCSSRREITLSIYLIQLPWHLIDYVILHELTHTKHLHHQKPFWDEMEASMADARSRRREIKKYRPTILPSE